MELQIRRRFKRSLISLERGKEILHHPDLGAPCWALNDKRQPLSVGVQAKGAGLVYINIQLARWRARDLV